MHSLVNLIRRRWPFVLAALALVLAVGAIGVYNMVKEPGDVTNENAEFQDAEEDAPAGNERRRRGETFLWKQFGYRDNRTRYLSADLDPKELKIRWKYRAARQLLEFPPVLAKGVLYLVRNDGVAVALNARSGRVRWQRRIGSLNASSPAYDKGRLYIATLSGHITSLRAKDGKIVWRKKLSSRSESSPIVVKGRVYFGAESGNVYAMRARDGKSVWTYKADGAVKSALAYADDKLYFGDYGGSITALDMKGKRVWKTGTSGLSFGRVGRVYSTPAVKFGRVYVGSLDGRVYSLVARNGQLAWSHSTGNYVYASPAVARVPGTKPTVYIGSYDGNFYALDARNGNELWKHRAGGKISGSATVVGRTVYFANLADKETIGLDVKTGKRTFRFKTGSFTPVISDGTRLYITGYSTQYGLVPREPEAKKKPKRRSEKKRRKRSRRN